jgi:hypothetical protein
MGASKKLFNDTRELEEFEPFDHKENFCKKVKQNQKIINMTDKKDFLDDLHEPKSELKEFDLFIELQRMIERVNEGYENELEMYCLFSDAEKAFKKAKESILPGALLEREKYEGKTAEVYGKKISFTQSGRYDYSSYQPWKDAKSNMDNIQTMMKNALNAAKTGGTIVDDNGEIIPAAVYTPSRQGLKLG